jgi:hypothetical protein
MKQVLLCTALALSAAACSPASQAGPAKVAPAARSGSALTEPSLATMRQATERFQDVTVALAEGYRPDPMNQCVVAEQLGMPAELGGMGIHYIRPDLRGIAGPPNPRVHGTGTHTDFVKPAMLIYEPQADGTLQLVAVENLVFMKAWEAAGNTLPPSFHGVPYDRMVDDPATEVDEAHGFEPHYDRHVWLYRENSKGIFTPFNPAVSCRHHKATIPAPAAHKH